jgi:hypothetical protein
VSRPEDAIEEARRAASGRTAPGGEASEAFERALDAERPSDELMLEWAAIRVDPKLLYSTRRFGAPMTAVKRALLRLLRQYTNELEAQQSRFNFAVLGRLRELEQRVARQRD